MTDRNLAILAVLAGVVLVALAIVYFAVPAHSLPGFIPGHEAGSNRHHVKHGLAALFLGLAAFAFAWFRTGPSSTTRG
jgi:uncharacterized membrane-anchored protein YitT (DUF2179 family)